MLSYHGDAAIKAKYVERAQAHRAADEVVQGTGWDGTPDHLCLLALRAGAISTNPILGKVIGHRSPCGERGCLSVYGYIVFNLHFCGSRRQVKAHRAIWIDAFGIPDQGLVVDHINKIRTDNRLENLRLLTRECNSSLHRSYVGADNPASKLSEEDKLEIVRLLSMSIPRVEIAARFSISRSRVNQIYSANFK